MQNPLFAGLVVYALNTAKSSRVEHFQPRLLHLLKDLKMHSEWEDLPWYPEIMKEWGQIPATVLIDLRAGFRSALLKADLNDLLTFGTAIRLQLMIDNAPLTRHKLVNLYATYVMQWEDGRQVEYTCRPYRISTDCIEIATAAKLTRTFAEHFIEAISERPGLDDYYENVAKPFDEDIFLELMEVLSRHVDTMPEAQQADYRNTVIRLQHAFGPAPELAEYSEETPAEPLEGDGGFQ
jgi:hypothetical protein